MLLVSYSSRPMRVLLPSSTLPAVLKRRRSISRISVADVAGPGERRGGRRWYRLVLIVVYSDFS
jgi:hypothetical protein